MKIFHAMDLESNYSLHWYRASVCCQTSAGNAFYSKNPYPTVRSIKSRGPNMFILVDFGDFLSELQGNLVF